MGNYYFLKRVGICICITDSPCCITETNTTLLINCVCAVCVLSRFSWVELFVTLWTVAAKLLCPWGSPGKNTGVDCHALLWGIFPIQGSEMNYTPTKNCSKRDVFQEWGNSVEALEKCLAHIRFKKFVMKTQNVWLRHDWLDGWANAWLPVWFSRCSSLPMFPLLLVHPFLWNTLLFAFPKLHECQGLFGKDDSQLWALRITILAIPPRSVSLLGCGFDASRPNQRPAPACSWGSQSLPACVPFSPDRLPYLLFSFEFSGKTTDLGIGKPEFKKCPSHLFFG